MTLYRLYVDNGNRAGFWVQHRSWANICAQVQSISGMAHGEVAGKSKLDGDVQMHVFDIRSGRRIDFEPSFNQAEGKGYARIAEPFWCHRLEQNRTWAGGRT